MKIYKPKKINKLLVTILFSFSFIVCCSLLVIVFLGFQYEGVSKRIGFLTAFVTFMSVGTIYCINLTKKILFVSYSFDESMFYIYRGHKVVSFGKDQIKNFKSDDNKISFQDTIGNKYIIPIDFEDFDEIQRKLLLLTKK